MTGRTGRGAAGNRVARSGQPLGRVGGRPGWGALRRAISGELALPGSPAYQDARVPFIAGLGEPRPQAVVRCHGPEDVAEVIAFAREHGIGIAIRSGGHSFAGYSSTSGIVIDLTTQRSVVLTGGVAKVGAGARLGELYDALLPDGLAIPASTCPSVGIGGLTLGGGHGILGRMYGLTLDYLTGARVVLESGQLVDCDEGDHAGARAPEQQMHAAKAWVMASWATVRPCGSGRVYPNFPIPTWTTGGTPTTAPTTPA